MEYSDLAVGEHTFQVRAVDIAGNADQSAESYTWTIEAVPDTEAPDTRILTSPADPSPSTVASVHVRLRGRRHVRVLARR